MEKRQKNGIILIIIGIIVVYLCVKADEVGLGQSGGQGAQQWIGTFVGATLFLVGTWLAGIKGKTLLISGIIIAFITAIADKIGLGTDGFGLQQSAILFIGISYGIIGTICLKKDGEQHVKKP